MTQDKHSYPIFVSYFYKGEFGTISLLSKNELLDAGSIDAIKDKIEEEKNIEGVVILNIIPLPLKLIEESLAVEPKFKVGDKVNVFDNFTQQTALCTVEKVIIDSSDISYEIKNNLGTDIKPESCLTLAEPTETH